MRDRRDPELGLGRKITRRDFLNGFALGVGAAALPASALAALNPDSSALPDATEHASQKAGAYYPPSLTGLRGSHVGAFETAHSLRDGTFWEHAGKPEDTGEVFDLVIVGGGISGLSTAHFFRKTAGPNARILILENHDDFGGHAKRNEFQASGRTLLGYGGTYSIESPAPYSAVSQNLIKELGIDVSSYPHYVSQDLYPSLGLSPSIFFDKETFGEDRLVPDPAPLGSGRTSCCPPANGDRWEKFIAQAPLSGIAKGGMQELFTARREYFPGLSSDEKKARMARMSYANFLRQVVGISGELISLYQAAPHPWFGVGIDAVSAQDAWGLGYPGFAGMNLASVPGKGMNRDAIPGNSEETYFFHFPDGNASIARLLVRKLIPDAIPGNSAEDVVPSRADYSKLDDESSSVRIRLNSTAVRVEHQGDPATAKAVEVTYACGGKVYRVRAPHCILACWHVVIPYLCGELPQSQRSALSSSAKVPLLYTNVALRNWTSFQKLGTCSVYSPGCYHTHFNLDLPVSIGGYDCPRKPEEPIVVQMMKTPCKPGLPARDQHRAGRMELFATPFETMERNIREQLARTLGPGGFDPARDITAITVNRWPHGYAYEYNSLWDDFWLKGGETPCEVARKPFGRIAIANADAGAYAYTDGAIDQAWRAVAEITKQ